MAKSADIKMAVLAVLIVLTSVICAPKEERLGEVEPQLMKAPLIETRVLAG